MQFFIYIIEFSKKELKYRMMHMIFIIIQFLSSVDYIYYIKIDRIIGMQTLHSVLKKLLTYKNIIIHNILYSIKLKH